MDKVNSQLQSIELPATDIESVAAVQSEGVIAQEMQDLEHIDEVYQHSWRDRFGEVWNGAKSDLHESSNIARTIALGAASVATQAVDRARIAVVVVPHYATEVLQETQSPAQAALVGAGIFWAMSGAVGETLNQGLGEFPQAKAKFKEEFPVAVDIFRDGLPGMNHEVQEGQGRIKRAAQFISRNIRRGVTGVAMGPTAFVATSSVDGASKTETSKLNLKVTTASAAVVGGVVAGLGQAITELPKHGYAETAKYMQDVATDNRFWWSLAGLSIASELVGNRLKRRKMLKQAHEAAEQSEIA